MKKSVSFICLSIGLLLFCASTTVAQEIGFVETFALAADRTATLKELVPGTDEYFFYHALQAQNTGQREDFEKIMQRWQHERNGNVTEQARELLNRQALLDYERDPQQTLAYLRRHISLGFHHVRRTGERQSQAPTTLDQNLISIPTLLQRALNPARHSLELEDAGLVLASGQNLTPQQRRNLLSRLTRPDYPGLVDLIVADLQYKESRGYGSLAIHGHLTLDQMRELAQKLPKLGNENAYVENMLAKLAPQDEVNLTTDAAAREAYFDRLWEFAAPLAPAHNALKANLLYNRLRHDLEKGIYDRERFLAYLRLPRNVPWLQPILRERTTSGNQLVQLGENFNLIALPPVPREEPLVRTFLLEFLKDATSLEVFEPYLRDDYLKPLLAEAQLVNGLGRAEDWAKLLDPEAFRRLKERVDIDFAADNPTVIGLNDQIRLTAYVKNVKSLIVNLYEINTLNYYRETGRPLNLALELDGLMASVSHTYEYDAEPTLRLPRTFEFPQAAKRGVYVIELIGNGRSSRALIQKGQLNIIENITAAGHAFTVLDEGGRVIDSATGWLAGREFSPDRRGRLLVPFSTEPRDEKIVIQHEGFATLVPFAHRAEEYRLNAGFYVDREALLRREKAQIILRPVLQVSGQPTSLELLEEPRLIVRSTDSQSIESVSEVPAIELRHDAETIHEILVPENTVSLALTLKAQVQNISRSRKDELESSTVFDFNIIEKTDKTKALHLGQTSEGYYLEARGKNGEPLIDLGVSVSLKHRFFHNTVDVGLKTDQQGRCHLGALADIEHIRGALASQSDSRWQLGGSVQTLPPALHGIAGEPLRVPLNQSEGDPLAAVSLLETRHGQFVRDWHQALAIANGFIEIRDLPAGEYSLRLRDENKNITLRLTEGVADSGRIVSPRRILETPHLAPLQVLSITPDQEQITIQLANSNPGTRVHLIATRYLPEWNLHQSLAFSGLPGLQYQRTFTPLSLYESGRQIGDEFRYVIDRRTADKFAGVMLERPSLLLNPWSLRKTDAEAERLVEGQHYGGRQSGARDAAEGADKAFARSAPESGAFVSLDFLKQPAVVFTNLKPDAQGRLTLPRAALHGLPLLRVLALDPTTAVMRQIALADTPVELRELQLVNGLDPQQNYAEQKLISPLAARQTATIEDVVSARFEACDTVAKAYRLLATLSDNTDFTEFGFITEWHKLTPERRRELYSKYACHELSFFLYHKDRKFFDELIAPYLRNKRDKTFLDHWLLGNDLTPWLEPWRFGRLNAVEKILLGKRLAAQREAITRDARERVAIIPPDMELFNRRFDTALQGSALDSSSTMAKSILTARENAAARAPVVMRGVYGSRSPERRGDAFAARGATPPAAPPADALEEVKMVKSPVSGLESRRRAASKAEELDEDLAPLDMDGVGLFADEMAERKSLRRFFQKLDQTEEWAENNYWHLPIERQVADLVALNRFWSDYAAHDDRTPFLSPALIEAVSNFTEMMLALAVSDLPFEAAKHEEKLEGVSYSLAAASPALLFHREIRPAERSEMPGGILVAQQFFRADDRYRIEDGERFDKLVTDEFLPQVVYGAQIVLTNPSGNRQKLQALCQIPVGAMPVQSGLQTRGFHIALEPYSTETREFYFYFPSTGDFPHYPVTVAVGDKVIGSAAPQVFHVVEELTRIDTTSWPWISQNGTPEQVLEYLRTANLARIESTLNEIAWRMKERGFYDEVLKILGSRHIFDITLWSYAIYHNDQPTMVEYLRHSPFADRCGPWLVSPLLRLDPIERFDYQHLEYSPLVNPRTHALGAKRTILNRRFREQYQQFMRVLSYKPQLDAADNLATAYYMLLQERTGEAITWFARVERKQVAETMQYDYLAAWLALAQGDAAAARRHAAPYAEHGVNRWRNRFSQLLGFVGQVEGRAAVAADPEKRDQAQAELAATEPALELLVEAGRIRLDTRNLSEVTLNFYPMDIELLFSRSPFLQDDAAQFSWIRPVMSRTIPIRAAANPTQLDLPREFTSRNVMVEAIGKGIRRSQAYYANTLKVQVIENYGQLVVTHAESGKPVARAYVKCYTRQNGGKVNFLKDGYTDLLGRFDYASLNSNELDNSERLSLLIMSDDYGALVREATPPKR